MLISNRASTILLVAILAVGMGIVAIFASNARGGPLDPPGPPASTGPIQAVFAQSTAPAVYTSVILDCTSYPNAENVRASLLTGMSDLNVLGAIGWHLVGAPTITYTGAGCVAVYTLERPPAAGTPTPSITPLACTSTPIGPTQTSTSTPTPGGPTQTSTSTPPPGESTSTPTSTPTRTATQTVTSTPVSVCN